MSQLPLPPVTPTEKPASTALTPQHVIRTDTVLARFPIHTLAKHGQQVEIHIIVKNAHGQVECSWQVCPNPAFGAPRQLAYKLDTLVINKKLDELGRPLPKVIRLGSLREIGHQLGFSIGQAVTDLRKAAHQNAGTYIIATLHYTATDGTERTLEAGFTRYSVVFTGQRLPDGTTADAVYLVLNEPYWEVLNNAPTRPLDYDYLKALTPAAQRCYEIISYKVFAALKHGHPHAKQLYSEYCTFAAQPRYTDYTPVKKQLYKIHKPHLVSTYLTSVRYERAPDADGLPDWCMYYVPGPKAQAEYAAFNPRTRPRAARPAAVPPAAVPEAATRLDVAPAVAPTPAVVVAPTAAAQALVQYFHQRFHGASDVVPTTAKVLAQAQDLMARYGVDRARHVIDFSVTAAKATNYHPQTLSGIVHYTALALADYDKAQQRQAAEVQAQDERRRAQAEEERRTQYETYRAERLAHLRATRPSEELAAIEEEAAVRFEREHTSQFGRDLLRRTALDNAVAAYGQLPSFAEWQAADEPHAAHPPGRDTQEEREHVARQRA